MIEQINNTAEIWWNWMWPMFWQVSVLIGFIALIDFLLRKHIWPQLRYTLWLFILVKLLLPPSFTLPTSIVSRMQPLIEHSFRQLAAPDGPVPYPFISKNTDLDELLTEGQTQFPMLDDPVASPEMAENPVQINPSSRTAGGGHTSFSWRAIVMIVWMVVTLLLTLCLLVRHRTLRRVHCVEDCNQDLRQWLPQMLDDTAKKLRLRRMPKIVLSSTVNCPAVLGIFRPMLLVPARGIEQLSQEGTEHILLHELAHIKRRDLIVHALCVFLQIFYWFNPLLILVRRQLQHLREFCCDATVAGILKDKTEAYSQTILKTVEWLLKKPYGSGIGPLGLIEDPGRLRIRLAWLRKKPPRHPALRVAATVILVITMFICVMPMARAEKPAEGNVPFTGEHEEDPTESLGEALADGDIEQGQYDLPISDFNSIEMNTKIAEAHNSQGIDYGKKGEYDQAILEFTKAIEVYPWFAASYTNRGHAYYKKLEYNQAIKDYSKALEVDPEYVRAYVGRGMICDAVGKYDLAISEFTRALKINPRHVDAYIKRGASYSEKQEYDLAIADFTKALEIGPKSAKLYGLRGLIYYNKGEYDRAISDLTKVIETEPRHASIYSVRAAAFAKKQENDRAISDFTRALEIDPKSAKAYAGRGLLYYRKGEHGRAISDLTKAIDLEPSCEAYHGRGAAYLQRGEYDRSIPDLDKAIQINPRLGQAYLNRGIAYKNKGDYDHAISDYTRALAIDPNDAATYYNRGTAYLEREEYDLSILDFNKAIEINPRYTQAYTNRGAAYMNKAEYDLAIIDFDMVIEINPRFIHAYINRTNAYLRKGEWDKVIIDCNEIIRLDTKQVPAYMLRAQAYTEKGKFDAAMRDYDKALELDPQNMGCLNNRGWMYIRTGELTKALADLNRTIEISPLPAYYDTRAWIFFHSGDLANAERDARKAMALDPKYVWPRVLLFRIETDRGNQAEAVEQARQFLTIVSSGADTKAVQLVLRYLLGEVSLEVLQKHHRWSDYEVMIRSYELAESKL